MRSRRNTLFVSLQYPLRETRDPTEHQRWLDQDDRVCHNNTELADCTPKPYSVIFSAAIMVDISNRDLLRTHCQSFPLIRIMPQMCSHNPQLKLPLWFSRIGVALCKDRPCRCRTRFNPDDLLHYPDRGRNVIVDESLITFSDHSLHLKR